MQLGLISTDKRRAIVGMGATGLSVARYFARNGQDFCWFDTRDLPSNIDKIRVEFPNISIKLGPLNSSALLNFTEVVVSPGIDTNQPVFMEAKAAGVDIIGDISLFARAVQASQTPFIAITGSNAKSTVTTLVAEMAARAGINVAVGGNLGTPALDLLRDDVEWYVLELSSFQLELVEKLNATVACILNMSPDHMDRYGDMIKYHQAKQRIYRGAKKIVYNREDALTQPLLDIGQTAVAFTSGMGDINQFGTGFEGERVVLKRGLEPLLYQDQLRITGRHNSINVLAALAIADAAGIDIHSAVETAKQFCGLAHRCESVKMVADVRWVNDSKATNVGATLAAINGLAQSRNLIIILGGQSKGQCFSDLSTAVLSASHTVILMGEAAQQLHSDLNLHSVTDITVITVNSMDAAVKQAHAHASAGDIVLLSPACASFDMFSGYEDRGDAFKHAIDTCYAEVSS